VEGRGGVRRADGRVRGRVGIVGVFRVGRFVGVGDGRVVAVCHAVPAVLVAGRGLDDDRAGGDFLLAEGGVELVAQRADLLADRAGGQMDDPRPVFARVLNVALAGADVPLDAHRAEAVAAGAVVAVGVFAFGVGVVDDRALRPLHERGGGIDAEAPPRDLVRDRGRRERFLRNPHDRRGFVGISVEFREAQRRHDAQYALRARIVSVGG